MEPTIVNEEEKKSSSNFESKLSCIPPSVTPKPDENIFVYQNVSCYFTQFVSKLNNLIGNHYLLTNTEYWD